jgi:hypothetical protein
MWAAASEPAFEGLAQLIRFNEAIDQILAEGVVKFTGRIDQDADCFTASVGHDLAKRGERRKVGRALPCRE